MDQVGKFYETCAKERSSGELGIDRKDRWKKRSWGEDSIFVSLVEWIKERSVKIKAVKLLNIANGRQL